MFPLLQYWYDIYRFASCHPPQHRCMLDRKCGIQADVYDDHQFQPLFCVQVSTQNFLLNFLYLVYWFWLKRTYHKNEILRIHGKFYRKFHNTKMQFIYCILDDISSTYLAQCKTHLYHQIIPIWSSSIAGVNMPTEIVSQAQSISHL